MDEQAALDELVRAHNELHRQLHSYENASRRRKIAAFKAHKAGASYHKIASTLSMSKTTAIRLVKDGEEEITYAQEELGDFE